MSDTRDTPSPRIHYKKRVLDPSFCGRPEPICFTAAISLVDCEECLEKLGIHPAAQHYRQLEGRVDE